MSLRGQESTPRNQRVIAYQRGFRESCNLSQLSAALIGSLSKKASPKQLWTNANLNQGKGLSAVDAIRAHYSAPSTRPQHVQRLSLMEGFQLSVRRMSTEVRVISLYEGPLLLGFVPVDGDPYNLIDAMPMPKPNPVSL